MGTAIPRRLCPVVVLAAALALLVVPSHLRAQSAEGIRDYSMDVTIQTSGDLLVRERIVYDFGNEAKHGILRDIVTKQRYDGEHDRVLPFELLAVSSETPGTPTNVSKESPGGGVTRLRIGDRDVTITGVHVYVIEFRLRGVLNAFDDHDELNWNAIGPGWDVPIDASTVTVHAPTDLTRVTCYAGPLDSRLTCDAASLMGSTVTYRQRSLPAGGVLTVVAALPKGAVAEPVPILAQRWSLARAFTVDRWRIGASAALLVLAMLGLARVVWLAGRDRRWRGQVVAAIAPEGPTAEERVPLTGMGAYPVEYTPPEGLRPGLIGTLLDETAHPLDASATIVDLATRGYLRIEEIEGKGWFAKDDWRLVRLKPSDGLEEYERLLLDALFEEGDEVLLSDLRGEFAPKLAEVQRSLYAEMVLRGWYRRSPRSTRNLWLGIGIGALVVAVGIEVAAVAFTTLAIVPLALILAALMLIAVHPLMPARTGRGTATYRRVLGFRRFILDAETYRARFAEEAHLFYEYLPYAIVFGATKQWAKAFEGLAVPPPEWFASSQPFTTLVLLDAMSSFSDRSMGALSYTPGASGASGFGGGFAGGGVGGGGGGSW